MRLALAIVVALCACKTKEKRAPNTASGPPAVASCDYRSEVLDGNRHSCVEIFDDNAVDQHEKWCNEMSGPRDHPTFARGKGCPPDGRHGGCLFPNGTVNWAYEGKATCIGGLEFKDAPVIMTAAPYRCGNDHLCFETMSVIDLGKTVDKKNCETMGNTFAAGSCATDQVVGQCASRDRSRDTTWLYYGPAMTLEQAQTHCEQLHGTFTPKS